MHGACILHLPPNLPTASISSKCSILIKHACAQLPLDYTEGYYPELAQ